MREEIFIIGSGITALYSANRLVDRGFDVVLHETPEGPDLPLLLNCETATKLIGAGYQSSFDADFCAAVPKHIVKWAGDATGIRNERPGLGCRKSTLRDHMRKRLERQGRIRIEKPSPHALETERCTLNFSYFDDKEHHESYGRRGVVWRHYATEGVRPTAVMEATDAGWLFAFPISTQQVAVLAMLPDKSEIKDTTLDTVLGASKIANFGLSKPLGPVQIVPAFPRYRRALGRGNVVHLGASLARLDPISGDGTGFTLRQVDRLIAALCNTSSSVARDSAFREFRSTQMRDFAEHLYGCAYYYSLVKLDSSWDRELASIGQSARTFQFFMAN